MDVIVRMFAKVKFIYSIQLILPSLSGALTQRIKTAIIFGIPVIALVFYSNLTRLIFLGIVLLSTSYEYLSINNSFRVDRRLPSIISLVVCLMLGYYSFQTGRNEMLIYLAFASVILLLMDLFKVISINNGNYTWLKVIFYPAILVCSLITCYNINGFREIVIGCLFLIWISDSAAYFVGRSIGKSKLMPQVSPGKTVEGFLGAGMITMIFGYLAFGLLGVLSLEAWFALAFIVWLFGSLGDLVESKLKRQLGIKDSGNILPGHGGFLDRFDGYIFCLPVISFYLLIFGQ